MRAGCERPLDIAQEEIEMRRFHVHVGVADLDESIRFYSNLFGAPPSVRKSDYAKWMIDEPRVNFAISRRGAGRTGVNHLGLQAESGDELAGLRERFEAADGASLVDEPNVHCCYARGDKHWVTDPQGIAWEAFHTLDSVPFYDASDDAQAAPERRCGAAAEAAAERCCGEATEAAPGERTQARATTACCGSTTP
jgi:catechol 2,3-dioxygenase-like lactoylglutathione lyase family enzyme